MTAAAIVYVRLLDEGTDVMRPTRAIALGQGKFRLLAPEDYDSTIETWEFLPGAQVRCELRRIENADELLAVEKIADAS